MDFVYMVAVLDDDDWTPTNGVAALYELRDHPPIPGWAEQWLGVYDPARFNSNLPAVFRDRADAEKLVEQLRSQCAGPDAIQYESRILEVPLLGTSLDLDR